MGKLKRNYGFSLTEVLLSVGILSVGMIFIAGVFPVGIHYTTVATERTKAAIVADEAFAKIKLYAVDSDDDFDPNKLEHNELIDFNDIDAFPATKEITVSEFVYPSTGTDVSQKHYYWSALCRLTEEYDKDLNPNPPVQVTVFVSRKVSPNLRYPGASGLGQSAVPRPVKVDVDEVPNRNAELEIEKFIQKRFINDGYTIVDDETGRIYRVLKRYASDDRKILLDRDWNDDAGDPETVWVVPPPVNGGRGPCIAVYQKVIRF
jgi:Tfp pilus assembly protein PilV